MVRAQGHAIVERLLARAFVTRVIDAARERDVRVPLDVLLLDDCLLLNDDLRALIAVPLRAVGTHAAVVGEDRAAGALLLLRLSLRDDLLHALILIAVPRGAVGTDALVAARDRSARACRAALLVCVGPYLSVGTEARRAGRADDLELARRTASLLRLPLALRAVERRARRTEAAVSDHTRAAGADDAATARAAAGSACARGKHRRDEQEADRKWILMSVFCM